MNELSLDKKKTTRLEDSKGMRSDEKVIHNSQKCKALIQCICPHIGIHYGPSRYQYACLKNKASLQAYTCTRNQE